MVRIGILSRLIPFKKFRIRFVLMVHTYISSTWERRLRHEDPRSLRPAWTLEQKTISESWKGKKTKGFRTMLPHLLSSLNIFDNLILYVVASEMGLGKEKTTWRISERDPKL